MAKKLPIKKNASVKSKPIKPKILEMGKTPAEEGIPLNMDSLHPEDPLRKMINGIHYDAERLVHEKKNHFYKDLNYKPIDQLKEYAWKRKEFIDGFDDAIFWDPARVIYLIELAVEIAVEKEQSNIKFGSNLSSELQSTGKDVVRLIQHLGFKKDYISNEVKDAENYLRCVESVDNMKLEKPVNYPEMLQAL